MCGLAESAWIFCRWRCGELTVSLTAMQFKVLKFFVSNPNRVISRDQLLNEVWGYDNYPCTRTVDNHVLKLRQKLEPDPGSLFTSERSTGLVTNLFPKTG